MWQRRRLGALVRKERKWLESGVTTDLYAVTPLAVALWDTLESDFLDKKIPPFLVLLRRNQNIKKSLFPFGFVVNPSRYILVKYQNAPGLTQYSIKLFGISSKVKVSQNNIRCTPRNSTSCPPLSATLYESRHIARQIKFHLTPVLRHYPARWSQIYDEIQITGKRLSGNW